MGHIQIACLCFGQIFHLLCRLIISRYISAIALSTENDRDGSYRIWMVMIVIAHGVFHKWQIMWMPVFRERKMMADNLSLRLSD